jgi:hypothetical protein
LKYKGQFLENSVRLRKWIDNNIDELFEIEMKRREMMNATNQMSAFEGKKNK